LALRFSLHFAYPWNISTSEWPAMGLRPQKRAKFYSAVVCSKTVIQRRAIVSASYSFDDVGTKKTIK
jgi:hypothetical protein